MNCSDVRVHLDDYDRGKLTGLLGRRISLHLNSCADCREEQAALRRVGRALDGYAAPDPPAGLARRANRVLQEVAAMERAEPPASSRWPRLTATLGIAAAAMGALLFAVHTQLAFTPELPAASPAAPAPLGASVAVSYGLAVGIPSEETELERLAAWSDLNNNTLRHVPHAGARALLNQAYADVILNGEKEADHERESTARDAGGDF